jgi:hypothetical protein
MVTTARSKQPVSKIAPVSKSARRIAEKESGRRMTDREIVSMYPGVECREIPEKIGVMDRLIREAWELVHQLTASGVEFAGDASQATLVIAGTAYAAWRSSIHRWSDGPDPAAAAAVVSGMADGIEFALRHEAGIPAMYAADYARVVAGSADPVDRMKPLAALARVWPDRYTAASIRFGRPKYASDDGEAADPFWAVSANILTARRPGERRLPAPRRKPTGR